MLRPDVSRCGSALCRQHRVNAGSSGGHYNGALIDLILSKARKCFGERKVCFEIVFVERAHILRGFVYRYETGHCISPVTNKDGAFQSASAQGDREKLVACNVRRASYWK